MKRFRKFILGGIAAVVTGGFAVFNVSLNSQNGLSSIHKANLEALSIEILSTRYNIITMTCMNNTSTYRKTSTT
jgi:hypothetical protein